MVFRKIGGDPLLLARFFVLVLFFTQFWRAHPRPHAMILPTILYRSLRLAFGRTTARRVPPNNIYSQIQRKTCLRKNNVGM
jgi:hypothetical protein